MDDRSLVCSSWLLRRHPQPSIHRPFRLSIPPTHQATAFSFNLFFFLRVKCNWQVCAPLFLDSWTFTSSYSLTYSPIHTTYPLTRPPYFYSTILGGKLGMTSFGSALPGFMDLFVFPFTNLFAYPYHPLTKSKHCHLTLFIFSWWIVGDSCLPRPFWLLRMPHSPIYQAFRLAKLPTHLPKAFSYKHFFS